MVTGASGFVGSHLMAEMVRRGLPVRGVSRRTAPPLLTVPSYGPDMDWNQHLKDVVTVVHLAARVHVMRETTANPLALFREANVSSTINLARQAAEAGARRLVFVSSIKVNGEQTALGKPFNAADPVNPQEPYGVSKAEAEAALVELSRQTGLEVTIIRPPLVYGPGVRGNFLNLMNWAASGAPSTFSAISNKRSFIYVANLCDLLITALEHPNAANRVLLASDGEDVSTHVLLSKLTIAAGHRPRSIRVAPAVLRALGLLTGRQAAVARLMENLQVDATPTSRLLGWHPPTSLDKGIELTMKNIHRGKPIFSA